MFNPLEVKPEYIADFGKKKGEKVDYAIFKDGTPIIFIEAKTLSEKLDNHDAQLARYYNATPQVRIAILTNGIIYKFFTDLNSNNMMDQSPFLTIDITNLSATDIEVLTNFRKESFETESLVRYAEELIYTTNLNAKLKDIFKNPPDDFIRFLIKDFSDTRITSNVIDRFRPIVKKSIYHAILEIVSHGLFQQEAAPSDEPAIISQAMPVEDAIKTSVENQHEAGRRVTTTSEELASLELIRRILVKYGKDTSALASKDTTAYFAVFIRNIYQWFVRQNLDSENKQIITRLPVDKVKILAKDFKVEPAPKGLGESRIFITSHHDLTKLEQVVVASFEEVIAGKIEA